MITADFGRNKTLHILEQYLFNVCTKYRLRCEVFDTVTLDSNFKYFTFYPSDRYGQVSFGLPLTLTTVSPYLLLLLFCIYVISIFEVF